MSGSDGSRPSPEELLDLAARRLGLILSIIELADWYRVSPTYGMLEPRSQMAKWKKELDEVEAEMVALGLLRER